MGKRTLNLDADRSGSLGVSSAAGAIVCAVLAALLWLAVDRQSLIGDAAYHLLAGDQALRHGTNQLNLEHPPLVKLVAALPLLREEPLAPPVGVDRAIETSLKIFEEPARVRRAQRRSRTLLTIVFALPLLACCFALGSRWGPRAGFVLALTVGLSFAVLPFLPVIQTDTAVTLGFVATILALLRYLDAPGPARAALVGAALGLAMASKYSGILLWPSVLFALASAPAVGSSARLFSDGGPTGRLRLIGTRLRDLTLVLLVSGTVLYATYAVANHAYDPTLGRDAIQRYLGGEGMITGQEMQRHAKLLAGAERVDPNLAQWLTGLLGIRAQNDIGVYPSYAFGSVSTEGRWWYFPAVLLIKTPLPLLLASAAALGAFARRRRSAVDPSRGNWRASLLLLLTAGTYWVVALSSSYNLGVRHLMPILPLLYLPAALWAARSRLRTTLVVGALVVEALVLAPLWMSATNTWWLGSWNPTRFALSGSDTEYRQNFLALTRVADSLQIETLHVLYPLLAEKELRAYIPRARLAKPDDPLEPGQWYAVSILVEQYLPAIPRAATGELRGHDALASLGRTWTPLWHQIARGEDHGYVAGSFHLYRLPADDTTP